MINGTSKRQIAEIKKQLDLSNVKSLNNQLENSVNYSLSEIKKGDYTNNSINPNCSILSNKYNENFKTEGQVETRTNYSTQNQSPETKIKKRKRLVKKITLSQSCYMNNEANSLNDTVKMISLRSINQSSISLTEEREGIEKDNKLITQHSFTTNDYKYVATEEKLMNLLKKSKKLKPITENVL